MSATRSSPKSLWRLPKKIKKRVKVYLKDKTISTNIRHFLQNRPQLPLPARESPLRMEVLIPCFNHGRFLEACLASVPPEIPKTVINDNSTDNTGQILKTLRSKFAFEVIENERNLLQGGSLNKAIELSANNLFVILNADDCLIPYACDAILQLFNHYPDLRLLGGNSIHFSREEIFDFAAMLPKKLGYLPRPRFYGPAEALQFRRVLDINMTMSSCTFSKSAWTAVGGFKDFDERVCSWDDRDFQMRVSSLFPVAVLEEPLAFYRITSSVNRGQMAT